MRQLTLVLVVAALGFSTVHAAPAKTSPFSNKSFGDGGGYKHPDAEVGQYFETKPQNPAELKPERPQIPAKVTPEIQPIDVKPSRPRPRPFAPIAATLGRTTPSGTEKYEDPSAQTSADQSPVSKSAAHSSASNIPIAEGGELDSASDEARRDYEKRLFGAESSPRRPGLPDSTGLSSIEPVLSDAVDEGMLFVSLELDPREAGTLRDAVAGLGVSAAFRQDARFQPTPSAGGLVRISGWLPVSSLGAAIARPGVKRVAVERGLRPSGDIRIAGNYLIKLRVSDVSRTDESIAQSVSELTAQTGFKLDRVFGVESVPGGGMTARVSGSMPVSQLARALGLPGVIQVSAALPVSAAVTPEVPEKKEGFLRFVMTRSLWLVLLTVLLILPTMGEVVKNGLAVFVPYR